MTMSPAAALKTPKTEPATVPLPEVQEALARRHAADLEQQDRYLRAYRDAVTLAAKAEPIPAAVADAAVDAAHALNLKASRMEDDIGALRRFLAYQRQEQAFRDTSAARHQRMADLNLEIPAARRLVRELEAEQHQLAYAGHSLVPLLQEQDGIRRDYSHLFRSAADMDDKAWRRARA
jgi:hypothetical protein